MDQHRRRQGHRLGGLAAIALLAGCARQSQPVSIGQALQSLQKELQAAGAISAVGSDPAQFAAAAHAAQCAAGRADPEVPLMAHDLTLDLTGSFSATGGFTVGSAVIGLSGTASATRGQTQELALPLTFVALSEVPAAVAAQRLAPLAGLPAADRANETRRIVRDRNALRARIDGLIRGWSGTDCAGAPPAGPIHPNLRTAP